MSPPRHADHRAVDVKPRLAVITCAVLETEVAHFARELDHVVHIEKLEQGLHNEPDRLRSELQATIDRIEERREDAEVIALGYGLCCRGTEGVRTRRCRLVMARAHDCITLLLGDKDRYARYVAERPGTYWYSPGWNRHHTPPGPERYEKLYKAYCEKHDPETARYLMDAEQQWFESYTRATYVDLGVGATDEDVQYTQRCADWLAWAFDRQRGDADLLRTLLSGPWDDERFVVLEPSQTIRMTLDDRVIEPADGQPPSPPPEGLPASDDSSRAP